MFSRLFVAYSCLSTAFTALAAAQTSTITAIAAPTATTISQCPTGDAQCCNTVSKASSSPGVGLLLDLLDIALSNPDDVVVGVVCSPITDIGVGQGPGCSQQPVCCSNNSFNGLIAIGCTPISL